MSIAIINKTNVRFLDMHDLSPEILKCLDNAGITTVGELSLKNGEEIFEILEKIVARVNDLLYAYYKNNIPSELLNDVTAVADEYKRAKLKEIEKRLDEMNAKLQKLKALTAPYANMDG